MENNTLISNVSDTSFWVAYYREQETNRADSMFKDPLAAKLVGDRGVRISQSMGKMSRYTAWSVVSRTVIIDRFIQKLIGQGIDGVINLGAGLDTRPYRMNLPATLPWVEVDFPNIIQHKSKVLEDENPKCQLTRVAVDLLDPAKRTEFFITVLPQAKKVLVLTEGVIPYMTPEQVTELSRELKSQTRIQYWITEYFHKSVYRYLKSNTRNKKMRNAPFLFHPEDWNGFFQELGWEEVETRFGSEIAKEFHRKPPMPLIARIVMPLLPQKIKQQSARMAGYMIFRRG